MVARPQFSIGSGMPPILSYLGGLAKPVPRLFGFVMSERGRAAQDNPDLPAARLTPGLVALAALDEWMVAVMKTPGRMPDAEGYRRVVAEIMAAHALYTTRGWIEDPAGFHVAPPPLVDPTIARKRAPGLAFEHLSFPSEYEPDPEDPARARWLAPEPNRTAHAWLLRHSVPDRPWVVCMHAFGMGYPSVDLWGFRAMFLHKVLGLNVVMPVAPLHGPRRIGRLSGAAFMTYNLLDIVHGFAQAVWDARRVLTWVRAQGGERVGLYGVSMGAHISALLTGLEPDLTCVLAAFPTSNLAELFVEHGPRSMRRRAVDEGLLGPQAEQVHRLATPLALPPRVPTERLFICAGLADRMATPRQALNLWEHWGRPKIEWLNTNHISFLWSGDTGTFVRAALETTKIA